MKNKVRISAIIFILLIGITCFCGCQSTDKSESYLDYSKFYQAKFEYNAQNNTTTVTFNTTITNGTIYNINKFEIELNLYNSSMTLILQSKMVVKELKTLLLLRTEKLKRLNMLHG